MSKIEYTALLQFIITTVHILGFIILSNINSMQAAFAMSSPLFIVYGILPFISMRKKTKGEIGADERDIAFSKKAASIGFGSFWIAFSLLVIIILIRSGMNGTIPSISLLYILLGGIVLSFNVRALATLILYRIES